MTRFNGGTAVYCMTVAFLLLQVGNGRAGPTSGTTTTVSTKPSSTATSSSSIGSTGSTLMLDLSNEAEAAANTVKSAVSDTSATLSSIMDVTTDGLTNLIKNTGTTALDFGSETTTAVEEAIKAGSRVTLAIGNLCNELFGGISATLATGTDILAMGTSNVDSYLSGLPVVGVVTTGLNGLVSGVSTTVNQMSTSGRESRQQLMKKLRNGLNKSYQTVKDTSTAATNSATTAAGSSAKTTAKV